MNDLVSIIIPVYNAEKFLNDTIQSILRQTYENWELLLINDCSTDNSKIIAEKYISRKIKWIDMDNNGGAALARNKGIKIANGDYICFQDADDLWNENKLKKQLEFMKETNCEFSFTSYEFANEDGVPNGKIVHVPPKINYKQALKNTTISTITVMFNMNKLNKEDIYMPNIRKGQDTATWWKVLKKVDYAYGYDEVLSFYRRTENTLSSNKWLSFKKMWNLYRNVEHLGIICSIYNFFWWSINAIKRRV